MDRKPLVFTTGVFICGIITADNFPTFPADLVILSAGLLILPFVPEKIKFYLTVAVLIAAGSLRLHLVRDILPADHIKLVPADSVRAVAGMIEDVTLSNDGHNRYVLSVDRVFLAKEDQEACGKLMIFSRGHPRILAYGDRVRLSGPPEKIQPVRNPGQFDYSGYLAARGIYHLYRWVEPDSVRLIARGCGSWWQSLLIQPIAGYARETFRIFLDDHSGALVQALLLGEKQDLEKDTIARFQKVGVVHVLAISGLHVGFIVIFAMTGFSLLRMPLPVRFWALLLVLLLYGAVVQFRPPVVRASLMAVFYLYAEQIERKPVTDNLLAGAALIILIADPLELYNPGFQFSFIAVASILHGTEKLDRLIPIKARMQKRYPGKVLPARLINWIWMPLLVSASAVIGTLPLTAYYYGMVPVVALIANLIVIPLIAGIVMLILFMLVFRPLSSLITGGIADMIGFLHSMLNHVVEAFAAVPMASADVTNPPLILVVLVTLAFFMFLHADERPLRNAFFLVCIAILVLIILPAAKDDRSLMVTFLDVGQGDAAFLRFPNHRTMLIDAGGADRNWDNGTATILPFLKKSGTLKLDYLVASHAHDDHVGGFPALLRSIEIDTVVLNAYPYHSKRFKLIHRLCRERGIPIRIAARGDRIQADPSCRVYVLHPDSACAVAHNFCGSECNNSSLVLKIQYGEMGLLFTGDLERSAEPRILMYGDFLESEILKIAHHGSSTSTSDDLLNQTRPVIAIVPVARKNKFRHPSPKTLARLHERYVRVYRTSHTGAIMLRIMPGYIEKIAWRSRGGS